MVWAICGMEKPNSPLQVIICNQRYQVCAEEGNDERRKTQDGRSKTEDGRWERIQATVARTKELVNGKWIHIPSSRATE